MSIHKVCSFWLLSVLVLCLAFSDAKATSALPTQTGLQKNEVTSTFGDLTLPDGSPIPSSEVEEGDTILCFVSGDPGFSTDEGRLEKVRPVPFGQQNQPGEGERVEPRTVTSVTPTGSGSHILNFESTPQVNPDDDPDAPGFDEIRDAQQVRDTVEQTQKTGAFLVGTALEGYVELAKIVSTERIAGWGFEGAIKGVVAASKLKQIATGARAVATNAKKNAASLRAVAQKVKAAKGGMSAKRAAKADDEIRLLQKAANEQDEMARQGTSMANRADDYALKAGTEARQAGCFVAGTPVWISDGTTKPIEQIKVGDLVLSKNEQTGEIAPKKVTNVSVRADIWTRKLSFDNGAVLETTDEHPLYVDGRGFVKAKEVGIGSSIVTRAGPSAKVVAVQADVRQATVYNFTVDEFHTYFVGEQALWAHNQNCPITPSADIWDHVRRGNGLTTPPGGFPRVPRSGVDGAHNMDQFIGQYVRSGEVNVLNMTPHPNLPGVYRVQYQIKSYDSAGNHVGWVTPSNGPNKTLYDPAVQNELDYFVRMTQARESARVNGSTNLGGGRRWRGQDGEGNWWEGFDNANGEYRTGYPDW